MKRCAALSRRHVAQLAATTVLALAVAACAEPGADGQRAEDAAAEGGAPPDGVAELTIAEAGLQTPESVLHDPEADIYLVSNINGSPLDADGNGFISRLSPDGELAELRWIDGAAEGVTLSAPKGMAVRGDSLFVTDIDVVRIFDRETGEPLGDWPIEGGVFVNDPAVGPDGTVYVTDMASDEQPDAAAVYRFGPDGEPTAIARGPALDRPNGITVDEQGVLVAPSGASEIYRLDPAGQRTAVADVPTGRLDGLVQRADGSLLVSSWEGQAVYRVSPDGPAEPVAEGISSPADIGYDATRSRVLIPVLTENRIEIRPVE